MNYQRLKRKALFVVMRVCTIVIMGGGLYSSFAQETTPTQPQVTEVNIQGATSQDTLSGKSKKLNEVVVTAYGTMKRKDVSASITTIKGDALSESPQISFDQALAGKTTGVLIRTQSGLLGEGTNIRIRGTNSISMSNQPLIVIDGLPIDGTTNSNVFMNQNGGGIRNNPLASINMNDVESFEILKDAAAAALYGSRAANGVILITTKRGKDGAVSVSYNGNVGWSQATRVPKLLNAQQFVEITNEKATNRFGTGTVVSQLTDLNGDGIPDETDWMKELFRTGFQQSHQVSFTAGTSKASMYGSVEYANQNGIVVANRLTRYSARLNGDVSPVQWLKVGISSNVSQIKNMGVIADGQSDGVTVAGYNALPNVLNKLNGQFNLSNNGLLNTSYVRKIGDPFPNTIPNTTTYGVTNLSLNNFSHPLAVLSLNRNHNTLTRFIGNAYANITPVKGLTLTSKIGVDLWKNFENQYASPLISGLGQQFNGLVQTNNATSLLWNWQNYANYNLQIKKHALNIMAGLEYQQIQYQEVLGSGGNFSDNKFQEILDGTYTEQFSGGSKRSDGFTSYFGRIAYNYDERYYIDASFRADAYSGFGIKNQTGYFPGVSVAWRVSSESFMSATKEVLDDLKIRASWGMVGNSNVGAYASRTLYSGGLYGTINGQSISQVGNANLQWESSMKTDIGVDVSFWKGRLGVTFDYWRNDISNMLLNTPVPSTSGLPGGNVIMNIGKMYNQGIELSLSTINIETKDFRWASIVNFTTVDNKIQKLSSAGDVVGTWSRASEGKKLGTYYLIEWAGVNPNNGWNGWKAKDGTVKYYNPQDQTYYLADGTPTTNITGDDAKYIDGKTGNPTWYGNFDNTFFYKGFDLTIGLQFSGGFWVYNATRQQLLTNHLNNNLAEITNRWQKPGDVTNIPALYMADGSIINQLSTQFLERGDFLRLRDITLGYNIPSEYLKKTGKFGLKAVRLYVRISNVAILTGYKGTDPELSTTANGVLAMGVENRSVPFPRSYNIGLNITF